MSSSVEKSAGTLSPLSGQNIVYGGIAWAVASLLFFLLFSTNAPGQESPLWYMLGTYILETLPFVVAASLCYRNWRSPQIASGRNVWLGIGLGMLTYSISNLLFGWWELYWGLDPDVSPADLFYMIFYLFLGWSMVLAVLPRRLNLETWQWITVGVIAALGIAFAVWLVVATSDASEEANVATLPPTTEITTQKAAYLVASSKALAASLAPQVQTNPSVASLATAKAEEASSAPEQSFTHKPPSWVISIEETLSPLSTPVNFFYIVADVFLLIIASTLLLAFWGGRFAQSWRMIAAATFFLYIADMYSKYAYATDAAYQSGSLLEVFYVFSGVLFAIGAALEYDVSIRTRRGARSKRA